MSQDKLETLPEGLERQLTSFLSTTDKSKIAETRPLHYGLFKLELKQAKLKKLLECVAHGDEANAQKILRTDPSLLVERGFVKDYSGRVFFNISPWEYMLWARDTRYMGQMMLDCIPDNPSSTPLREALVVQFQTLKDEGITYQKPTTYKDLIRLDGAISPLDREFHTVARLFQEDEALIFWNDDFFYVNKKESKISALKPSENAEQLITALLSTPENTPRKPSSLQEQQLINKLFSKYPAFNPTSHRDSHYDYSVIKTFDHINPQRTDGEDGSRQTIWKRLIIKQCEMPAHILQHFCEPKKAFYPLPNFKADKFIRTGSFFDIDSQQWIHLFNGDSLNSDLGMRFGLIRSYHGEGPKLSAMSQVTFGYDIAALRILSRIRDEDAEGLHKQLIESLRLSSTNTAGITVSA